MLFRWLIIKACYTTSFKRTGDYFEAQNGTTRTKALTIDIKI